MQKTYTEFLAGAKNLVFLGEPGSGKTETALSFALGLAREGTREVHFFDMDQTKPLFRARDCGETLESEGVVFHFQYQLLDAPTVPPGVGERLADPESTVFMDVGGGSHGSHMIGQYSELLSGPDTRVLYIVNPYRPWSRNQCDIAATASRVLGAARLEHVSLVAAPNLGPHSTAEDVLEGMERIKEYLPDREPEFVCVLERLIPEVEGKIAAPIMPIRLNTLPDWLTARAE